MYDYSHFYGEISTFKNTFVIGKSHEGRNIYAIKQGDGENAAVFAAAFHSLEYLTSECVIDFARKYENMNDLKNKITLYTIPVVNPDGIEIVMHGIDPKNPFHRDIITHTGIIDFTKVWQANAFGVDINHNFNADWEKVQNNPSPTKYGGVYPESEPETRAVADFLRKIKPALFIAFHSQGKEIYYDFNGMESKSARQNAEYAAQKCGYIAATPVGSASFGGAKDFYIKEFGKAAFTVELGIGKNPLPHSQLNSMITDTYNIATSLFEKIF